MRALDLAEKAVLLFAYGVVAFCAGETFGFIVAGHP